MEEEEEEILVDIWLLAFGPLMHPMSPILQSDSLASSCFARWLGLFSCQY